MENSANTPNTARAAKLERTPFGALLLRLREAAGLTQEQLAARAGLSPNAISALESGKRRTPRFATVELLAAALALDAQQRQELVTAARASAVGSGGAAEIEAVPTVAGVVSGAGGNADTERVGRHDDAPVTRAASPGGRSPGRRLWWAVCTNWRRSFGRWSRGTLAC